MPRQTSGAITGLEAVEGILNWALRLAALLVVLITGYYLWAVFAHSGELFRGLAPDGRPMSLPDFQRHAANLEFLTKLLLLGASVLAVTVVARYYAFPEAGAALLAVGALLFLGMPFLIDTAGGTGDLPGALRRFGSPRLFLKNQYALAGAILMATGTAQLIFHACLMVAGARNRRPQPSAEAAETARRVRRAQDRFLGRCWELPFCRDTDKKLCPVRTSGKPCWRTGRGCYCDQNIILQLTGGNQYLASRGSAGYLSRSATVVRPKTLREKREQCLSCPVYLHHQGQKYRLLAPAAMLGAVGAIAFYWTNIRTFWPDAVQTMGRALSGFSFGSSQGGVPGWAADLATNPALMWMSIFVLGCLAIAYLLQGVEWVLYRLGI